VCVYVCVCVCSCFLVGNLGFQVSNLGLKGVCVYVRVCVRLCVCVYVDVSRRPGSGHADRLHKGGDSWGGRFNLSIAFSCEAQKKEGKREARLHRGCSMMLV
jgi:hypothetical protein